MLSTWWLTLAEGVLGDFSFDQDALLRYVYIPSKESPMQLMRSLLSWLCPERKKPFHEIVVDENDPEFRENYWRRHVRGYTRQR